MIDANFIANAFRGYFLVLLADTDELREQVYRLRYEVYCRELGWEDPSRFPEGMEKDAFDPQSKHCLLYHRPSKRLAGTVRLILADPQQPDFRFPFEIVSNGRLAEENQLSPASRLGSGEISRLAVISAFRRRTGEQNVAIPLLTPPPDFSGNERRVVPHLALGLYLAGASVALMSGLSSAFVMMESSLARRLSQYGIVFEKIGDEVDHHGMRGPYRVTDDMLFANLSPQVANLLEVIREDLADPNISKTITF